MSLGDLAILYLVVGLGCAVAIYRTSTERPRRAAVSAALAVPLWPLWAPIVLTAPSATRGPSPAAATGSAAAAIEAALAEGVEVCAGTSFEALLSREAASRITAEVARASSRRAEIDQVLRADDFDLGAAERKVAELEQSAVSPRSLSTARLHLENIRRLHALRDRDATAIDELADLVQALRTQLLLARFAGSSVEGVGGIVSEVWARVEGLGAAIDAQEEAQR
jgi:hypothetical protein